MKGLGFKNSGDEWHLIIAIHDGVDGLILCVIDIQVYDLIHPCLFLICHNWFDDSPQNVLSKFFYNYVDFYSSG